MAHFPPASGDPDTVPDRRDAITMRHFAFRVDGVNFKRAQERMRWAGVEFRRDDHGVSDSIYVRDPDGHEIEITTYDI